MVACYVTMIEIYAVVCKTNHNIPKPTIFNFAEDVNPNRKRRCIRLREIDGYVFVGKIANRGCALIHICRNRYILIQTVDNRCQRLRCIFRNRYSRNRPIAIHVILIVKRLHCNQRTIGRKLRCFFKDIIIEEEGTKSSVIVPAFAVITAPACALITIIPNSKLYLRYFAFRFKILQLISNGKFRIVCRNVKAYLNCVGVVYAAKTQIRTVLGHRKH